MYDTIPVCNSNCLNNKCNESATPVCEKLSFLKNVQKKPLICY